MQIDLPEVIAEVKTEFERYEQALVSNDIAALNEMFRNDARTIRYGVNENLYGYGEIAAFRAARSPLGVTRTLSRTVINSYGRDHALASTLLWLPPDVAESAQRASPRSGLSCHAACAARLEPSYGHLQGRRAITGQAPSIVAGGRACSAAPDFARPRV
jgi:hypothetical protein